MGKIMPVRSSTILDGNDDASLQLSLQTWLTERITPTMQPNDCHPKAFRWHPTNSMTRSKIPQRCKGLLSINDISINAFGPTAGCGKRKRQASGRTL